MFLFLLYYRYVPDGNIAPPAVEVVEIDSEPVSQGCTVTEIVEPDSAPKSPVVTPKPQPSPSDPTANKSSTDERLVLRLFYV